MPLNKLSNFIKNTDGRTLYVNPNDYIVVYHKQINFYRGTTPTYYLNFINKPVGNFFQLSHVFSKHGYIPYNGKEIINSSIITGTKGRFIYRLKNKLLSK